MRNLIKKYNPILVFAALLFFSVSCEDYLEEQPSTLIDSDYIYTTEDGIQAGVVSLYKFYRDRFDTNNQDYSGGPIMPSRSDITFSRSGYTGLIGRYERAISEEDFGSTGVMSNLFWQNYYKIASRSTDLINAAEAFDSLDPEVKAKVIAEAKFFRADAYFTLYRLYNNIYVTEESVTVENAFDVINDKSSKEEIFALIKSDLTFAIDNLEWTDEFGRVTKGTAKHMKAKVAMWEGDWEEAKTQAVSTIEEGPHSLVSSTKDVFAGSMDHSEQLFVLQFDDEALGGGNANMLNANYVTQYFQIDGIEGDVNQGGRGFSRVLPNRYLLGLLAEDENDDRDNDTYFRKEYFYTSGSRVGQKIEIYGPITEEDPDGNNVPRYYQRLAPACVKFAQLDDDPENYRQRSNVMIYRLAETYLIAAEAMMRSSGNPLPYINAVRERAGAAPLETVNETAILDERARELAFEGQRWFTLKRMGQEVMNRQMRTYSGDGEFFPPNFGGSKDPRLNWQDHFINFAIAQTDLDLLGADYPQNDGY